MPATAYKDQSGSHRPTGGEPGPARDHRAETIPLTTEGRNLLEARVAWLADERIPELEAHLGDPDRDEDAVAAYDRAMVELTHLTGVLGAATTTDAEPERHGIVELGDEVVVELGDTGTERFLIVHPVEAPLDDFRVSVEAPFARALIGRRVGEAVEVDAPAGAYRCRIVASARRRAAAAPETAGRS